MLKMKGVTLRYVFLFLCFFSFCLYMQFIVSSNNKMQSYRTVLQKIDSEKGINIYSEYIPVMFLFSKAKKIPRLSNNLRTTVSSIIRFTSVGVYFHICGDKESFLIAEGIITDISRRHKAKVKISFWDIGKMTKGVHKVLKGMQKLFSSSDEYFSHSLFTISIAIHRILPSTMQRLILLDTDLKFNADIQHLYNLFSYFNESNVIGIGRESQPVYRRAFSRYRARNPGTLVGDPPPNGLTGFNSGVLLLHLEHMRKSKQYNYFVDPKVARNLRKKYLFDTSLGDQDFYSLLLMEHKQLFYALPCSWNRQLCRYHERRYADVFQKYFECKGPIKVYHGNCKMEIPMLDWEKEGQSQFLSIFNNIHKQIQMFGNFVSLRGFSLWGA